MNKLRYLSVAALFAFGTVGASAAEMSETGQFLDGVAAVVNEGVVLKSELNRQLDLIIRRATAQGMQLPPAHIIQEQVL